MDKIFLTKDISHILDILNFYGRGYIIGGYIRDTLLGIHPKDCDFCTDISYKRLLSIFSGYSSVSVGKSFGVIKIHLNGLTYDIAKMRRDVSFTSNRRETGIEFVDNIMEDLQRRDFTINSIAYDGRNFVYGSKLCEEDINGKTVRFIGLPSDRIKEDPLRMLRGIRLFTEKNLKNFDYDSLNAIKINANLINNISMERIREEFVKILLSDRPKLGIIYLLKCNLLQEFLPELYDCYNFEQHNPNHHKDVFGHSLLVLENTKKDIILRLAALFHDIGKPNTFSMENGVGHFYGHNIISTELTHKILSRLNFSKYIIDAVSKLVYDHMSMINVSTKSSAKKIINRVGIENIENLYFLSRADILGSFPPYNFDRIDAALNLIRGIIFANEPLSVKDLKISGKDIINLGITDGILIGEILKICLAEVLENPDKNNKEILIHIAKCNMHNNKISEKNL
ncbi:MAG: CCA tRNA nucleotidyltransferase [Fusobacteriaceae bacterium]|nr:CCA tRNA nucleotidyltransferase [Fusobacteriaceae bacterium]